MRRSNSAWEEETYARQNNYDKALLCYLKARELKPHNMVCLSELVDLSLKHKDFATAEKYLHEGSAKLGDMHFCIRYAKFLLDHGHYYHLAEIFYKRALEKGDVTDRINAKEGLCSLYHDYVKNYAKAEELYLQYLVVRFTH